MNKPTKLQATVPFYFLPGNFNFPIVYARIDTINRSPQEGGNVSEGYGSSNQSTAGATTDVGDDPTHTLLFSFLTFRIFSMFRMLLPVLIMADVLLMRFSEEDPDCKPLRKLCSVVDPDHLLLDHFLELRRRLREVDDQVAELRHEVMKLQRAVDKGWVADMEHLLAEKHRCEEQLLVKEREQVELETRGELFVEAMRTLGMLPDGEEELNTIGSVTGRGRVTFRQPVKSAMAHPNAGSKKTAPMKHVRFSLHNQ